MGKKPLTAVRIVGAGVWVDSSGVVGTTVAGSGGGCGPSIMCGSTSPGVVPSGCSSPCVVSGGSCPGTMSCRSAGPSVVCCGSGDMGGGGSAIGIVRTHMGINSGGISGGGSGNSGTGVVSVRGIGGCGVWGMSCSGGMSGEGYVVAVGIVGAGVGINSGRVLGSMRDGTSHSSDHAQGENDHLGGHLER